MDKKGRRGKNRRTSVGNYKGGKEKEKEDECRDRDEGVEMFYEIIGGSRRESKEGK